MMQSSLIGHTCELLGEVLQRPAIPADSIIQRFFRDRRYLGSKDRAFISDTLYAALRAVLRVRWMLAEELDLLPAGRQPAIILAAFLMESAGAIAGPGESLDEEFTQALTEGARVNRRDLAEIRRIWRESLEKLEQAPEPIHSAVVYGM